MIDGVFGGKSIESQSEGCGRGRQARRDRGTSVRGARAIRQRSMVIGELAMRDSLELSIARHHSRRYERAEKIRHKSPSLSLAEYLVDLANDRFQEIGSRLVLHDASEDVENLGKSVQDCVAREGFGLAEWSTEWRAWPVKIVSVRSAKAT